jgi:signal transduction histidine kinase
MQQATERVDRVDDVALLRRQLARERKARQAAEQIGEQVTADLFNTVQQLRAAESELREHAEVQRTLHVLARGLRTDLEPRLILQRAVTSIGEALGVDRCLVRLTDGRTTGRILEQWTAPGVAALGGEVVLSPCLDGICVESSRRAEGVWIDDVGHDPRLTEDDAQEVLRELGSRSYGGTPMWVGSQLVGWLVLHQVSAAQPWTRRHRVVAEGLARDLGTALLQAQAFQEKAEAVAHLQEVNAVKTAFVSTVSHELRTPLTSISGYVEVLADETVGGLNDRQQQVLNVVARNTDRLMALVEDLLALSQSDTGELSLHVVEVDLAELVAGVGTAASPLLAGRNLTVEVAPVEPGSSLAGDAEQLSRLLLHLLSNAVKFTPDGGAVRVAARSGPETTTLAVEDTGHGIEPDDLPRVFDRFYRTELADQHAIQGPGLGLSVVRSIVEQHGGEVDIASTPGRGTTVTVALPTRGKPPVVAG